MTLAGISLAALLAALVLSCTSRVNVGVVALAMAWVIAAYVAPWYGTEIGVKKLVAGFPSSLFLTLVGVTLLFMLAEANGTLARLAHRAVRLCRGNVGLVPLMFFALTTALSTIGVGSIASAALVAPMAMAVAVRARIPPLLMMILVGHGGVAGGLSKFALTGIVVNQQMDKLNLSGYEWRTYGLNLLANTIVAVGGYLVLGGWRLFGQAGRAPEYAPDELHQNEPGEQPFTAAHWFTLAVILALIVSVVGFKADVGMAGFAGAMLLIATRMADERAAMRALPWGVIVMVCGVSVLVSLVENTGGIKLFTELLSRVATQHTAAGLMALVTGVISIFSSTSGVVLPTFLPMVPDLVKNLGGGDPLAIASAINVGSGMVDVSPVSTIGALCLAATPASEDRDRLFMQLLAWGVSMSVVGAIVCHLMFEVLW